MSFIESIRASARRNPMRLILPEGTEPRTLQAARKILDGGLAASVTLVGCPEEIERAADSAHCDLRGLHLIYPECCEQRESFAAELYRLRRLRGMTVEQAWMKICDPLGFAAMLVRLDQADTLVAGAASSTAEVLKAVFTIIGLHPDTELASSFFIMHMPDPAWGEAGHLLFSDCATIPNPDSRQLSEIALAAAESFRVLLQAEPRVAMLSFSTFGSASDEMVDKVAEATAMAKSVDRRRDAVGCGSHSEGGGEKGSGFTGSRKGECADLPRPQLGKHRLQAGTAAGRSRSVRSVSSGHGQTSERSVQGMLG